MLAEVSGGIGSSWMGYGTLVELREVPSGGGKAWWLKQLYLNSLLSCAAVTEVKETEKLVIVHDASLELMPLEDLCIDCPESGMPFCT